jgi:hypothetical protein
MEKYMAHHTFSACRHLLPLLGLILCLSGFSSVSFAMPQVAQPPEIKDCRYLQDVVGNSGYGKNNGWQKLAKYAVFSQAERIAATHLVWVRFDVVGAFNGVAVAKAYR